MGAGEGEGTPEDGPDGGREFSNAHEGRGWVWRREAAIWLAGSWYGYGTGAGWYELWLRKLTDLRPVSNHSVARGRECRWRLDRVSTLARAHRLRPFLLATLATSHLSHPPTGFNLYW